MKLTKMAASSGTEMNLSSFSWVNLYRMLCSLSTCSLCVSIFLFTTFFGVNVFTPSGYMKLSIPLVISCGYNKHPRWKLTFNCVSYSKQESMNFRIHFL
ncbi:unnamed protein product [Moneuplotes crassus]|uniref:Uncharacterized protein n=1 Tax=Euplotes crassus TaxID=5936 RepID=A0AAD1U2J9_EUPCR|nr:unnamed protein product [Moneuplotes crassus]